MTYYIFFCKKLKPCWQSQDSELLGIFGHKTLFRFLPEFITLTDCCILLKYPKWKKKSFFCLFKFALLFRTISKLLNSQLKSIWIRLCEIALKTDTHWHVWAHIVCSQLFLLTIKEIENQLITSEWWTRVWCWGTRD